MTSKKLLSLALALIFALSLVTALPVSAADYTVVAKVGSTVINDGDFVSSTGANMVFTLSNGIIPNSQSAVYKLADNGTWSKVSIGSTGAKAVTSYTVSMNGKAYSNSTYKVEFNMDASSDTALEGVSLAGADYSLTFKTSQIFYALLRDKNGYEIANGQTTSVDALPLKLPLEQALTSLDDVTLYKANASGAWETVEKTNLVTLDAAKKVVSFAGLTAGAYKVETEYNAGHTGADTVNTFYVSDSVSVKKSDNTSVASFATIAADETITITLPAGVTVAEAEDVVLYEHLKSTTLYSSGHTFPKALDHASASAHCSTYVRYVDATPNGNVVTIDFEVGDLSTNSFYTLVMNTDDTTIDSCDFREYSFSFKTSAPSKEDGAVIVCADNFSRYAIGNLVADADTHYPFFTRSAGFDDAGNKYPAEITTDASGTKVLRVNNSTRYNSETVVSYMTAYSAAVTDTYYKAVTEVEFSMLDERAGMYEIGGIIFKIIDDTSVDVYARTTHEAWNGSYSQTSGNWKLLERVTFKDKETKDGKHILKYITTHYTDANDKRTLHSVELDNFGKIGQAVLGTEGILMGTGNHSVLHQGVLLSNAGTFKNASSVTFDIMNPGGASTAVRPYMDIYSIQYYEYIAPPITIESTSAASGSTISPVGSLTFTFDTAISESSLATGLVFEEKDKRDIAGTTISGNAVPLWQTRVCKYGLSPDGKTVTIAFKEGDLAANSEYRVRLTTLISSAEAALDKEYVYEYKTSQYQNYYLNENFNRFPVQQYSYGYAAVDASKPWTGLMMPFAKFYGSASTWVWGQYVIENDNGKALQMKMVEGYTGAYGYMGLRNDYSPEIAKGVSEHNGTYEFEFDVQGTSTTVFEVGDFVLGNLGGEEGYSLMVRTGGAITGVLGDGLARVSSFAEPTATPAKYTLKYEITLDRNDAGVKRIHKAWLNGNEITLPVGGIAINLNNEANQMADSLNFAGKTKDYNRMFGIGDVTTVSADAQPILNIYSIKYYATGLNAVITETAAGSVSITLTNDGAAPVDVVPVLAVYNGSVLVGFDGLNDATTVSAGTPATVTRTVANAASGNTYKVMLLNSKTELQPLMTVYQGVIE